MALMALLLIFILACILRFLYFPHNIYFGYDQARDAYAALEIAHGHLKIIGPSTSFPGLFHGVLYYYILAPLVLFWQSNPEIVAAAMRVLNACGVFLVFYLASILFSKKVGLLAALLYAVSFEESQFAIYMGNPSLAILSIVLMFLGLATVIFQKKDYGLPLALLGYGLSVQFQFALFYLIIPLVLILLYFRKSFLELKIKTYILSIVAILLSLSTFIIAEFKFGFRTIHSLISLATSGNGKNLSNIINTYLYTVNKMISFNLTGSLAISALVGITILVSFIYLIRQKDNREKMVFLGIWFFGLLITFYINGGSDDLSKNIPLYYPNIGISIALIIFVSFIFSKFIKSDNVLVFLTAFIVFLNLHQINSLNPKGTIVEINAQQGMLLSDEKQAIDYMYKDAQGPFAAKAVTMPADINTTWSYLFEWYGQKKYGYVPIWNGKNAVGFAGNLKVQEAQEGLPRKRYVIIEPLRGVPDYLVSDHLKNEDYFTDVVEQKYFGQIVVQKREKI